MILRIFDPGLFLANCYIVGSEETRKGILIDPSRMLSLRIAERAGLSISLIVATHAHPDHVGAVTPIKEATGAEFLIHEAEPTRGIIQFFSRISAPLLRPPLQSLPKPDRLLHDGDTIELDDLSFKVFHTPGHSPGGICLLGHGVVFTGDTLFNHSVGLFSYTIGRIGLAGLSYNQLKESIVTKLMSLPDETRVLPGHGPETTIGFEREWNPFLQEHKRRGMRLR
jgi:glyoxylase-like metal-dependent hydrolase (beta-lactamase superfamily II)